MSRASVSTGITAQLKAPPARRTHVASHPRRCSSGVLRIVLALALAAAASGPASGGAYAEVVKRRGGAPSSSVHQAPTGVPLRTRIILAMSNHLQRAPSARLRRWGERIATSAQRSVTTNPSRPAKAAPARSIDENLTDDKGGYVPGLEDMFNSLH